MKKSILIFLFTLLGVLSARAYDFIITGVYYNIISGTDEVEVTSGPVQYSGSVVIPSTVAYSGTTYTVTSIGTSAFSSCHGLTSVAIPNGVTSIGANAFQYCSGLTSVTIPNGVTSIGANAFQYCRGLTSVTIPESVDTIGNEAFSGTAISSPLYNSKVFVYMPQNYKGEYAIPSGIQLIAPTAFDNCSGLTSVNIPESVTSIGEYAFYQCSGLTSVTIPESVTTIGSRAFGGTSVGSPLYTSKVFAYMPKSYKGDYTIPSGIQSIAGGAFYDCSGLTSVTIPEGVTSIGKYAFYECTGLRSVTIPNSVTSIEASAFAVGLTTAGCRGLSSVTIGEGVTSIGAGAFCSTCLRSVTIPESVTSIGASAFMSCVGLRSVTIGEGVTSIGDQAFWDCRSLTSVTIPNSVTSIGDKAFFQCYDLTSVTIGESVNTIGYRAFGECWNLTSVEWNAVFCLDFSYYDRLFTDEDIIRITSITFGSQVEHIPAYLCSGWDKLTSVTIPESVTSIGIYAFYGCTSIRSPLYNSKIFAYMPKNYSNEYEIPSGIQSIASTAFAYCSDLTSVTIPESITSIWAGAFYECSGLTSVTIPKRVDTIGESAFAECSSLTSVTSLARKPPYCYWYYDVFSNYSSATLHVPHGCKAAYQSAEEWNRFSKIEELPSIGTAAVTVNVNDASMGRVTGGGEYEIDEEITLKAIPNPGYHFERWDDGSTDNPRLLTVAHDITLTAIFAQGAPTPNENSAADNFRVYVQGRTITLSEDRGLVQVYNVAGQCVYNGHATAIPVHQSGVYIVAVGSQRFKVLVR